MINNRAVQSVVGIIILIALVLLSQWGGEARGPVSERPAAQADQSEVATNKPDAPHSNATFDYYVLVLSWSPTHCSSGAGRGRDDDLQCRSGRPYGFVLHGLWPQYERGYPQNCASNEPRIVARGVLDDVLKISPSEQLVQHEWEKHGTCSGLSQRDYFATGAQAFESMNVPSAYDAPERPIMTTPNEVRQAFLDANRVMKGGGVSATCSGNELAELWICLDRKLGPRACSNEVRKRHCGGRKVRMRAVRGDWPGE